MSYSMFYLKALSKFEADDILKIYLFIYLFIYFIFFFFQRK